jgi:Fur family ferric uptake transcriptional regulator
MQNLNEILKYRKIQPTAMRILVLKELQYSKRALSLNEMEILFNQADKTTLYRTLKTFEKNKLVHSIEDGTGSTKYALCEESCECLPEQSHIHFHCQNCGETFCIPDVQLPKLSLPKNFLGNEVNLIVKGVCDKCNH